MTSCVEYPNAQSKSPHPKIMLVDADPSSAIALVEAGYSVTSGSLGVPYAVNKTQVSTLLDCSSISLPNYEEHDIYVIDMQEYDADQLPTQNVARGIEGTYVRAVGQNAVVDPRPVAAVFAQPGLDAALERGGAAFIVFARPATHVRTTKMFERRGQLESTIERECSSEAFLSVLEKLSFEQHHGTEMTANSASFLGRMLTKYARNGQYHCTLTERLHIGFAPVALDKFGRVVGGAIRATDGRGIVLILPHFADKAELLLEIVRDYLPTECPHLYPDSEGGRWVEHDVYELGDVLALRRLIAEERQRSQEAIGALETEIASVREEWGWLHTLLTGTDRALTLAVKRALELLGFQKVVDADAEVLEGSVKREDLRIEDGSPLVLVETKGISGLPTEEDALQADKYVQPRMKLEKRTDIRSLAVINQQRHLPALNRDSDGVFQDDVLTTAMERELGLMTSWDLFILVRGFVQHGWRPEDVRGLFYQSGRIEPIPLHYKRAGSIGRQWPKASAVMLQLGENGMRVGDRIAFRLPHGWVEEETNSLRVDDVDAIEAHPGQEATVMIPQAASEKLEGLVVYVASRSGLLAGE